MEFKGLDLDIDVEAFLAEKEEILIEIQESSAVKSIASWKLPNVDEPFDEKEYLENAKRVFCTFCNSVLSALDQENE